MERLDSYDFKRLEAAVLDYWKREKIPQKLYALRKGGKPFYLLDGPPYVNSAPHVGHVKTRACKDVWRRMRSMQGFDVYLQPGFDCHGLPVEVMVEKELGSKSKQDVEAMGIEKFDALCLQKVLNNEKIWLASYERLGDFTAFFEPYFTYKPYYIESAWWTIKTLDEKGFLVEGEKPIHWCPHCETALSGYEVSDSYKDVSDPSVFVKFKVKGKANEYLLVWTTTPWTLPANVAVAVSPRDSYVKVKVGRDLLILAEKRADKVLGELCGLDFEVVEKFEGKALEGLSYEPLLDVEQQGELNERARKVYLSIPILVAKKYKKHATGQKEQEEFADFVTMDDGTGLVHVAPGHGATDHYFGRHYNLPVVSPVDEKGRFTGKVSAFQGKFVKQADKLIIELLDNEGKLLFEEKITHSYPLCWRCKSPLIFRLSRQWYLSVDRIKEKLLSANEKVNWMPAFGKEAMNNWLGEAVDWCVSQQRFWGIPLPVWVCGECGRRKVVGSVAELRKLALKDPGELGDLHRHSVDSIALKCKCGNAMARVKDILNVWFDSSIAPWASFGYPHRNKELFEHYAKDHLVDLITESQDQVRGWFYVLLFSGMAAFGKKAFDNCAMMGWVVDEKGQKMSKSIGNVVSAEEGIDKLGADAIRLYYCWEIAPWDVQKFSFQNAREVQRALNILWNVFVFYDTYKPKGFKPLKKPALETEDEWLYSRLDSVFSKSFGHAERFEFHHSGRTLVDFVVNDFSRWYVKLVRDRASDFADGKTRDACFTALHHGLRSTLLLLAPYTPFITEYLWHRLGEKQSIHLQLYGRRPGKPDEELERLMTQAMQLYEASNSLRKDLSLKLRWPVKRVVVSGKGYADCVKTLNPLLRQQLNALQVEYSGKPLDLPKKELKDFIVYLDTSKDQEIANLCLFRETVRAVQASRKENGLVVSQRIELSVSSSDEKFNAFLAKNLKDLSGQVGAGKAVVGKAAGNFAVELEVEGTKVSAAYSVA